MADPPLTDGERWSRRLLADLAAGDYRPGAWLDFVARSRERAATTRRERPALARQARRWGMTGAVAVSVGASAGGPSRRTALAWWGLCWAMLEAHLGMVEGPAGERRPRLTAADGLTLGRAALVPFAAAPAGRRSWIAIVAAGASSDLADGPLARRDGETRLGRDLDALTDVAFFSAAALGAARAGWVPRGAALALQARHLGGAALLGWHWFARGSPASVVYGAARWSGPPSAAALVLGAAGRRGEAGALLAATSLLAVAAHLAAARGRQRLRGWGPLRGRAGAR